MVRRKPVRFCALCNNTFTEYCSTCVVYSYPSVSMHVCIACIRLQKFYKFPKEERDRDRRTEQFTWDATMRFNYQRIHYAGYPLSSNTLFSQMTLLLK